MTAIFGSRTRAGVLRTEPGTDGVTEARSAGNGWPYRVRLRLAVSDVLVVFATVLAGVVAPHTTSLSLSPLTLGSLVTSVFAAGIWIAMLAILRTRDKRVLGAGASEYKRVVNATLIAFCFVALGSAFAPMPMHTARGLLVLSLPGLVLLLVERWLWRRGLVAARARGHFLWRAIVVGRLDDVRYVLERMERAGGPAFSIEGIAAEAEMGGEAIRSGDRIIPVIARVEDAASAAQRVGADAVIVAGQPEGGSKYIRSLAWSLEPTGAELVLSSHLADVAGPRIHFRPVEGLPLLHVETPKFEGGKHVLKRGFDLCAAGFGLALLALPMLIIALAIKLDDGGPVFFRQRRSGKGGEPFEMLKFRSMTPDAEARLEELRAQNEGAGPLFKLKSDPRVTRIGGFLRAHSLDEVPQLINVFQGQMSMVGPRPPLPSEVEAYNSDAHRRLFIKPGLTGLWQVSGRSDLSWEEGVRLDLYYVENWSLTGDLMLIWRTIKVVVRPEGAY